MDEYPKWLLRSPDQQIKEGSGTLLFVCTGNVCRSALASSCLRAKLPDHASRIQSAGILALSGQPLDPRIRTEAVAQGVPLAEHVARQVTGRMLGSASTIVIFSPEHRQWILTERPDADPRVLALGQLTRGLLLLPRRARLTPDDLTEAIVTQCPTTQDDDWVEDPYEADPKTVERCVKRLALTCDLLASRVTWS